jgi:hypothetical protein
MRTLATPKGDRAVVADQPAREKLIKIGAKIVSHGRYLTFQWPTSRCRQMFAEILSLIAQLRSPPAPA